MSIPANIDRNSLPQFSVQVAPDVHKASGVNSLPPELVTPGDIRMGGSGVASLTKAKKGDMIEGADNLATLKENCGTKISDCKQLIDTYEENSEISPEIAQDFRAMLDHGDEACKSTQETFKQLTSSKIKEIQSGISATSTGTVYALDKPPLSKDERDALAAEAKACLQNNTVEATKALSDRLTSIISDGLPTDQGSLNDIMAALMVLQIKYAMEGKKANREMSAEMASTIYQNAQKIAANIMERGELAYKQAMVGAFVNFTGAVFQASMTFAGNAVAYKKETKDTHNIDKGALGSSDAKQDKYNDPTKQAIIAQFGAIGSLGQAATGLATNITNAVFGKEINDIEVENKKLEALNRLIENTQQGYRDLAESFNSSIKTTFQAWNNMNSSQHEATSGVQRNMSH